MIIEDMTTIRNYKHLLDYNVENNPDTHYMEYKTPDGIAVKTYRDLQRDADAFCLMARDRGLKHVHMALVGPASYEWTVAFLGITNSSNAAVPLSPTETDDMNEKLVDFADCEAFLYDKKHEPLAKSIKENIPSVKFFVSLDNTADESFAVNICDIFTQYKGEFNEEPASDELCAIMFTSGTTGFPKGVMLTHKNFIYTGTSVHKTCPLPRMLGVLPLHHAFGLTGNVTKTLVNARTLCLNDSLQNAAADLKLFKPNGILAVPQIVHYLMRQALKYADERKDIMSEPEAVQEFFGGQMIDIISGGAPLEAAVNARYNKTGILVLNGYGMTECAPIIANNANGCTRHGSVGKPIPCMDIKFDNGEILLKGPNVMKGYYRNPEATKEVFTDDGWFRTGDLGHLDSDGFLYITGRCKNLILLDNGENVSAEFLEEKLYDEPLVKECVCFEDSGAIYAEVFPDKAYAEKNGITDIKAQMPALIARVNSRLAAFQHISGWILRDIPLERTASKKIKRGIYHAQKENKNIVLPKTKTERKVFNAVKELLQIDSLSMTDSFFTIGGDSLNAVELALTLNVKPQVIYNENSLLSLSRAIDAEQKINSKRIENINEIIKSTSDSEKSEEYKCALITGATGFLGVHILRELTKRDIKIYALVRDDIKLRKQAAYYFDDFDFSNITPIKGDITKENLGLDGDTYSRLAKEVDVVFHVAADVHHAGDYQELKKTNVTGTENVIAFCLDANAVMQHTSTVSVHGAATVIEETEKAVFDENILNIGQHFSDNVYIHSKYRAEERVITARERGLKANIYRIGNLTWRSSDGKFQINSEDNGFIHRLRAIIKLGVYHENSSKYPMDLTPVDECADAYVRLAFSNETNKIYHMFNQNYLDTQDLFKYLNLPCRYTSGAEMIELAYANRYDRDIKVYLFYLVISGRSSEVKMINDETVNKLKKLGFSWCVPDTRYLTVSPNGGKGACLDFEPFTLQNVREHGGTLTPIQKITLSLVEDSKPIEPTVIRGAGSLSKIKDVLKENNIKNPLFITVNFKIDALERLLDSFEKRPPVFTDIKAEPTVTDTDNALKAYIDNNCDGIVAVGGGSVLDTAKITALRATNKNAYLEDIGRLDSDCNKGVFLAAVPTTAGTGSEVTLYAVALEEDKNKKKPFMSDKYLPEVIILDPELTVTMPKSGTAFTGIDALSHAVESALSLYSPYFADDLQKSYEAIKLVFDNLVTAVNEPGNITARENMQEASFLAGLSFRRISTGYIHAVAHRLGEFYHTPHGLAIAAVFTPILRAYLPDGVGAMAQLAKCAGVYTDGKDDMYNASRFIEAVDKLISDTGIDINAVPFDKKDSFEIARKAGEEAKAVGYPRPFTDEKLREIIEAIFGE